VKIKILILVVCFVTNTFLLACSDVPKQSATNSNAITDSNAVISKTLESKNGKGIVSIEAAVVSESGDVKPVARTNFFLLDTSFENILKESNFKSNLPKELVDHMSKSGQEIGEKTSLVSMFAIIFGQSKYKDGDNQQQRALRDGYVKAISQVIKTAESHSTYVGKTDFQGKAQILDVEPGRYYLFGFPTTGEKTPPIWNIGIEVSSGQNSIVLDQDNSTRK
jgi:hypothetical protein